MPNPPRTDVLLLRPGAQAKPSRGIKFFFGACGAPNVMSPGTLAIWFNA